MQAGVVHVIWAYHSLDPDSLITLDSLVPEGLGSTSFSLLRRTNEDGTEKIIDFFIDHVGGMQLYQ